MCRNEYNPDFLTLHRYSSAFIIFISDQPKVFWFLIIIILIQQLDGNIIAPKILGKSTGLSSLGVLIAITIMGAYFGIVGMIIGVPVFAVIIGILNEFIEKRLALKGLATNTTSYYPEYSSVEPNQKPQKLFARFFAFIGRVLRYIKRQICNIKLIFNKNHACNIEFTKEHREETEEMSSAENQPGDKKPGKNSREDESQDKKENG